jgi:hypothetical protein
VECAVARLPHLLQRECSALGCPEESLVIVTDEFCGCPPRSIAVDCGRYLRPACPRFIVCMSGVGLLRSRATIAMRRVSRSGRLPVGWDERRPPSRRTCMTRLRLTKTCG